MWSEVGAGDRPVIYVGATALHPAARAEKHLRSLDPAVGRLRDRYPARGGDLGRELVVQCVEIRGGGRRALVKAEVARLLQARGLLSPRYCGDEPGAPPSALSPDEQARPVAPVLAVTPRL